MRWMLMIGVSVCVVVHGIGGAGGFVVQAQEQDEEGGEQFIWGVVRDPKGDPAPDARVELRDHEGRTLDVSRTNERGEFVFVVRRPGVYALHAASREQLESPFVVITVGAGPLNPVMLVLAEREDMMLEVRAPVAPIRHKASSEIYTLNQQQIQGLPRGENVELHDVLLTLPSAVNGSLKQVHIRQDHDNLQIRIDGVPIPETVSSTFTDVISPRAWQEARVLLGGLEAQYGNKTAAVVEITTKRGRHPPFGSVQLFGGSFDTINPSIEYGTRLGDRWRVYGLHSYTTTARGIDPPTLGHSSFHNDSQRNETLLRADYQAGLHNAIHWLFLQSIADFEIPTIPGRTPNPTVVGLIRSGDPAFTPVASQDIDERQEELNQYTQLVWQHDWDANRWFNLAAYARHTRATFFTDPLNVLAFTEELDEPFSAGSQDRLGISGGVRFDYTHRLNAHHLVKAGFQVDRTQAINKTRLFAFARDVSGDPTGPVLSRNADSRTIGWREEVWVQDQWTPTEALTINAGVRLDYIQALTYDAQVSPRLGISYAVTPNHVLHAFYGRLFTPPNLEAVRFAQLNTIGTTAEPENLTNTVVEPERAHYVQIGSSHAFGDILTLQLTAYYKNSKNLSDAGQFGTTPLLNFFAFQRGIQYGWDAAVHLTVHDQWTARGNVAWGRCKGKGLQSGHFLLEQKEIDDINSGDGVFCDHMQLLTSSAIVTYRVFPHTTITGQMLFGSGLRSAEPGAKTNSGHSPSYTVYNLSLQHEWKFDNQQTVRLGIDVLNLLDQRYFLNEGEGSIGLGVSHAGLPRSYFFRAQWLFGS
ncbi:MAG: TonB-dependent receptor [Nitrospirae bacterium]|nr:MAG: TonB-dependent receptor [Nitrospirota bacterium]